ncbi:ChaB family protein [bacterium]|nr:ChaB family protein [bacterium]
MPYDSNKDLPKDVRDALPKHAQEIYREAYNSAHDQYQDQDDTEATANRVAWSAVKNEYKKNDDGEWVKKD